VFYADPKLNINWQLNEDEIILSEKDKQLMNLAL
jgi:dTDP-4-dehydrorhamnose 3,5-epimerase-like enzyme